MQLRTRIHHRIRVFTDRYPLLGPLVWVLSVQYFAVQIIAAEAWWPPYSWTANFISDLGNTACGLFGGRYVCSPLAGFMNASFMLLGVTMAVGSLLIYTEFRESRATLAGFGLMALAGLGTLLVGLFPENTVLWAHELGAFLAFGLGNLSLIILALAVTQARRSFRLYTLLSGVLTLIAFVVFLGHVYLGLGRGGMERLVSYPQTVWLILFGLYMTATRFRASRRPA